MNNKKLPGWLVLTIISCVAAILLAATNLLTRGIIKEHENAATLKAYQALIPEADTFEPTGNGEKVICKALKDGRVIGYTGSAISKGFGGEIEVTVGVGTDGKLTGISVGGSNFAETAGMGAKAKDAEFTDQFKGLGYPVDLSKNGGRVDAITGATITSGAVLRAVNKSYENLASEGLLVLDTPEEAASGETADGMNEIPAAEKTSEETDREASK